MMAFMKEMKNTTELTDEEIAALAAAKIQDNKPKSRMQVENYDDEDSHQYHADDLHQT